MCYLLAKKYDKPGCIAFETVRGKHLSEIISSLGKELLEKNIQILSVSSMDAYGEYKPYKLMSSEEEFMETARLM